MQEEGEEHKNIIINYDDLRIGRFIGSGAFGNVYRGFYKDIPVAIKELKSIDIRHLKNIRDEIATQTKVDNPYIIKVYGCCFREDEDCLLIVMELADCSLSSFLRKERKKYECEWMQFYIVCRISRRERFATTSPWVFMNCIDKVSFIEISK